MDTRDCLIALNMVDGLGSIRITELLKYFSTPKNIFKAGITELSKVAKIGTCIAQRICNINGSPELEKELREIDNQKARVVTIEDADYPSLLKQIYDPPIVLYVMGDVKLLRRTAVAIVGCRRATFYGLKQAEALGRSLSNKGICVVSGFARGIDTAAHKGALSGNGSTVVVLGSGLMCIYPPENKKLAQDVKNKGAIISEFPLRMLPLKGNFPRRNRIISGLSKAVVVVEAARRSGSLITADLALSQGREVYAVPGAAGSISSQGTNGLIKEGAKLVENAEDIIEDLAVQIYFNDKEKNEETQTIGQEDVRAVDCDKTSRLLLEILSSEPMHIDLLIKTTNLDISLVCKNLLELQLKGLVQEIEGKRFIKKEVASWN